VISRAPPGADPGLEDSGDSNQIVHHPFLSHHGEAWPFPPPPLDPLLVAMEVGKLGGRTYQRTRESEVHVVDSVETMWWVGIGWD